MGLGGRGEVLRTFLRVQANQELSIIDHANYPFPDSFRGWATSPCVSTAILNSQRRIRRAVADRSTVNAQIRVSTVSRFSWKLYLFTAQPIGPGG